jgi:hypothetical protein
LSNNSIFKILCPKNYSFYYKMRLKSKNTFFVMFQLIGTNSVLPILNGPKILPCQK